MIVYLFELDSVRNSLEEIEIGRKALYEEIVKNGNTVAFSMNQIVDSRLFLSLIQDKEEYENIYQLFENGTLRISPQDEQATASKHIQQHIRNQDYLFSGIIGLTNRREEDIVEITKRALMYADLHEIDALIEQSDEPTKERYGWLKRYVEIILHISVSQKAKNKQDTNQEDNAKMIEFLDFFMENQPEELIQYYQEINTLEQDRNKKNYRSWWYRAIQNSKAESSQKKTLMAIVDLSYNYSIERTIENVVFHYRKTTPSDTSPVLYGYEEKSLREDFAYRLQQYLESPHVFPIDPTIQQPMDLPKQTSLRWADAYTISRIQHEKEEGSLSYEDGIDQQRQLWQRAILKTFFKRLLWILGYSFVFVVLQYFLNMIQGISEKAIWNVLTFDLLGTFGILFFLGLFGSWISEKLGFTDLLVYARDIRKNIELLLKYMRCEIGYAYSRKGNPNE